MSVDRSHSIGEYDTAILYVAAANILMHLDPGIQTKEVIKFAGFKQVDIEYDTYQKRICKTEEENCGIELFPDCS